MIISCLCVKGGAPWTYLGGPSLHTLPIGIKEPLCLDVSGKYEIREDSLGSVEEGSLDCLGNVYIGSMYGSLEAIRGGGEGLN